MAVAAAPASAAKVAVAPPPAFTRAPVQLLQRSCDCGGAVGLSGKCETCADEHMLRRAPAAGAEARAGEEAPAIVHRALAQSGSGLAAPVRQKFEAALGHDFSKVRIHDGPLADAAARAVGARAFTVGPQIVFRAGAYQPGSAAGGQLLAHELTHTLQQAHAPRGGALRIGPANDAHERQARAVAAPTAAPAPVAPAPAPARAVQRDDAPAPANPSLWDKAKALGGAVLDMTGDAAWALVKAVAPGPVIDAIQGIRGKGILGWLKDKLAGAFKGILGGLSPANASVVSGLLGTFTSLLGAAKTILAALGHGDCKPLFDAVSRLGDTLGQMAGDAWDKIKSFLAPVGDFFADLWKKFGAPAVDFLTGAAADIWNGIKDFASQLWNAGKALVAPAWNWLKTTLGIGDGADGQNGVLQWVQGKLSEAWEGIKTLLQPVIAPMQALGAKIAAVLPIDAILNLRAKVHEWLGHAGQMVGSMQNPKGVTQNQASLREKILPAIKAAIVSLGGQISAAGGWVAAQIGGLVQTATQMLASVKSNAILGALSGAIDWLGAKMQALGDWVGNGVRGLFDTAGQAVAKLSGFVEPVLGVLQKLASVIGNVVKQLPGLVMGPVWALIPACIKDPIKDFIIQHILSEIPIISTFVKLPDIWGKIQKLVLDFLAAVFVNGDLSGAAMMVVRFVLEAAGVDVKLVLQVFAKAISSLDDIMMHPGNFVRNIGSAIVAGFQQFWKNIGHNLFMGVQSWLLASLAPLGVTPMPDISLGSIFRFVMQVLGLSLQKLRARLEKAVGAKTMGVVDKVANIVSQAWDWLSLLWNKGPAAVWEEIKSHLADLGTAVMSGIAAWIGGDLIKIGIEKLAKLSNPAGAIIELIQTIYKTISFVVTKMNRILAMANAVLDSIGNIVKGNIGPAAGAVEKALVGAIGTVLAFLADWLGVSDPGVKLKGVVEKVQAKVEAGIDWLIAKALTFVKKLLGKDDKKDGKAKNPKWDAAVAGVNAELTAMEKASPDGKLTKEQIDAKVPTWKTNYAFNTLKVVADGGNNKVIGGMSPEDTVATAPAENDGKDKDHPIDFAWVKPVISGYPKWVIGTNPEYAPPLSSTAKVGDFTIGVTYPKALAIAPDAVIQAGPNNSGSSPVKDKARDGLKKLGWNNAGLDVDHVWELQVGGVDASENLWPLSSSVNQESGRRVRSERSRIAKQLNLTDINGRFLKLKFGGGP